MKAVHFGAGSIGRGFIGDLLNESGYEITLVDIDEKIIKQINASNSYDLFVIEDHYRKKTIKHVQAVSSLNEDTVIEQIEDADIITTSVWADNLSKVAPTILKGLKERQKNNKPRINILACENAMFNSELLRDYILKYDGGITGEELDALAAFPNTAVDRLVLMDYQGENSVINIGKDFELVIEKNKLVDPNHLPIKEAVYTNNLQKYIEKKLYIINGGHAWAGYIGYLYGYDIIQDVFNHNELVSEVREAMLECADLLAMKYDFDKEDLVSYVDFSISRFQTPGIRDTINRVCRSPIRKLASSDRLVGPALESEKYKLKNDLLIKGIAAAFLFRNADDSQANQMHEFINKNGIKKTITHFTGIKNTSPLFVRIVENYNELLKIANKYR